MNTREVQQRLVDIGWPIAVDGSYGTATFEAVRCFQQGYSAADLLVDGHAGPQTWHALDVCCFFGGACGNNFWYREFKSRGDGWIRVNRELVRGLVRYRQAYGPTSVVSGYRDPGRNRAVGGASNSQHLYGNAADIPAIASVNAVRNLRVFSGIGHDPNGKVRHVDVRHVGPNSTGGTPANPTIWRY